MTGLGMRHISWVQVIHDGGTVRAVAHGLRHRLPATVPITLRQAAALTGRGVPLVVRAERTGRNG